MACGYAPPARFLPLPSTLSSELLLRRRRGFLLRQLKLNVPLDRRRICANNPPPVHKNRRRACDFHKLGVGHACIHGRSRLGRRQARLESGLVQPSLTSKVHRLVPSVRRRDQILTIVEPVVHPPEGIGLLREGAASSQRSCLCPRVNLF